MLTFDIYRILLVSCFTTLSTAIRVDWGTNKGPIVPPTPRTTVRPQLPYREPAPVWEDQSDDIPNPNPYVYVLPPPSRPRTWPIPFAANDNYNTNAHNYGQLLTQTTHGNTQNVNALSPKYVPNIGIKYVAVVPKSGNDNVNYYLGYADKQQGKYNAKTKKYKAYEKSKYTPYNYMPLTATDLRYLAAIQLPTERTATTTTTTKATTTAPSKTTTTTTKSPKSHAAKLTTKYGSKFDLNMKQSQQQTPNALFSSNTS